VPWQLIGPNGVEVAGDTYSEFSDAMAAAGYTEWIDGEAHWFCPCPEGAAGQPQGTFYIDADGDTVTKIACVDNPNTDLVGEGGCALRTLGKNDDRRDDLLEEIKDKLCEDDCQWIVQCDEDGTPWITRICDPDGETTHVVGVIPEGPEVCVLVRTYCGNYGTYAQCDDLTSFTVDGTTTPVPANWATMTDADRRLWLASLFNDHATGATVTATATGNVCWNEVADRPIISLTQSSPTCRFLIGLSASIRRVCTSEPGVAPVGELGPCEDVQLDVIEIEGCANGIATTQIVVLDGGTVASTFYMQGETVLTETPEGFTPGDCPPMIEATTSLVSEGCYDGKPAAIFVKTTCPGGDCEEASPVNLFTNGDLEGTIGITTVPPGWAQIPFTDTASTSSGSPRDTSDITGLTGHSVTAGIAGTPNSGSTFVTSLSANGTALGGYDEGLQQNVTGLTVGSTYQICFWQAVVQQTNATAQSGGWDVWIDNTLTGTTPVTTTSQSSATDVNLNWEQRCVTFVATATSHDIKFNPHTPDALNPVRMGIDTLSLIDADAAGSCCVQVECVAVIPEGQTTPITPAEGVAWSLAPCPAVPDIDTELELEATCALIDGVKTVVWQVIETVFVDGAQTAQNEYLLGLDGQPVDGEVVACDPDIAVLQAEVCDPDLGTLIALTIDGTTSYYDPTNGQEVTPADVNAITAGACPLPADVCETTAGFTGVDIAAGGCVTLTAGQNYTLFVTTDGVTVDGAPIPCGTALSLPECCDCVLAEDIEVCNTGDDDITVTVKAEASKKVARSAKEIQSRIEVVKAKKFVATVKAG